MTNGGSLEPKDSASERQRLYDVLDTLPVYVILLSPDYHVAFANRYFRERFGEDRGLRCFEYLFGRSEACENCETYKTLRTGAPQNWEWTGPDGRDYDIYDLPFTDVDGSPMILETGIDITERKIAQDELIRYRDHLEELVRERTARVEAADAEANRRIEELKAVNEDLVRINRAAVDRELRMIELKQQINALCAELGKPPRYRLDSVRPETEGRSDRG